MSPADLAYTSAADLARMIRAREVSAVEVMRATLARAEKVQAAMQLLHHDMRGSGARRCRSRRRGSRPRRHDRSPARGAAPREGPRQHQGRAHDVRLLHPRAQHPPGRQRLGGAAESLRRNPVRQDDDARVRSHGLDRGSAVRPHAQRMGCHADIGRLIGRCGRCLCRRRRTVGSRPPAQADRHAFPPPATGSSGSSSRSASSRTTWRPRPSATCPTSRRQPVPSWTRHSCSRPWRVGIRPTPTLSGCRRRGSSKRHGRAAISRACASPGVRCSATQ